MRLNLNTKILAVILTITLVVMGIVVALLTSKSSEHITTISTELAETVAKEKANEANQRISNAIIAARTLAETMEAVVKDNNSLTREQANTIIKRLLEENPEYLGILVAFEPNVFDGKDSEYVNAPGHDETGRFIPYWNRISGEIDLEPCVEYDEWDYYQLPKKLNNEVIIEPYVFEGALLTDICVPIHDADENVVGVACIDVNLYDMNKEMKNIKLFDSGYGYLLSNSGQYITHPNDLLLGYSKPTEIDVEMVKNDAENGSNDFLIGKVTEEDLRTLEQFKDNQAKNKEVWEQLLDRVKNGEEGIVEAFDPYSNSESYIINTPVNLGTTDTPWGFVVSVPKDEMLVAVGQMKNIGLIAILMALVLLGVVVTTAVRKMLRPLHELEDASRRLAQGNLNIDLSNIKSNDEIGALANVFQQMANNIKDMIIAIQEKTELLTNSSNQLKLNAQQTAAGANETAATMNEISMTVQQVTNDTQGVADVANDTSNVANEGKVNLEDVSQQMQKISTGFIEINQSISELTNHTNQIGQIVDLITQIAEQTNLLALNAAIEAARAGEAGKGFAVVADEVRSLAEQSSKSALDIKELIEEVQHSSTKVDNIMATNSGDVEEGTKTVQNTTDQFVNIIDSIEVLSDKVLQVASATEQMSAGVQNVAAATEEQTASMEEVSAAVDLLDEIIRDLEGIVAKYNQSNEEEEEKVGEEV